MRFSISAIRSLVIGWVAHIIWRVAFQQACGILQPLQKFRHGVGIEAGFLQELQADAVGFFFVRAGVVELLLYRSPPARWRWRLPMLAGLVRAASIATAMVAIEIRLSAALRFYHAR